MADLLEKTRNAIREKYPAFEYTACEGTPVTPLHKPLSQCKLALVTTGGLHLQTEEPFDTRYLEGDCSYRVLPAAVRHEEIAVTHDSYDHKFIDADLNCVFPIERMREYVAEGVLGSLSEEHVSFMGHIYVTGPLLENAAAVGQRLRDQGVDVAFLTPT